MKAISPKTTFDYVCKCDRDLPKEDQTIWELSHLTAEQEAYLEDRTGALNNDGGYQVSVGSVNLIALHMGLKGVRGFYDENGNKADLVRDERKAKKLPGGLRPWTDKSLSMIHKDERDELADVIRQTGVLDEEELKNSQSAPVNSSEKSSAE